MACDGLYVIRRSTTSNDLVLSFFNNGGIFHYEIRGERTHEFQLFKSTVNGIVHGPIFRTVRQMRDFYLIVNPLNDIMMPCRLTIQVGELYPPDALLMSAADVTGEVATVISPPRSVLTKSSMLTPQYNPSPPPIPAVTPFAPIEREHTARNEPPADDGRALAIVHSDSPPADDGRALASDSAELLSPVNNGRRTLHQVLSL